eukprot:TRINITY_DN21166_c0_g2_i1.p1 TRINITY_DN21166_c0_g2~~TRINITY_DN21166_c0_g2_i1.p1  ORF type:complete len:250 (+),score=45.63 TRINITY_DN21166_c0_g2_i1:76-825(+)
MVFTVFCAADVYGSKWNLSVEAPKKPDCKTLVELVESAFEYEADKWKPKGVTGGDLNFHVSYLALMEKEKSRGGKWVYYSGRRVNDELLAEMEDGVQIHAHQLGVLDTCSPLPPPRSTISWRLVELYGFKGPESQLIPALFFKFDTRKTANITRETMTEAFPNPKPSMIKKIFSLADPHNLGYITFGAWLELGAEYPKAVYAVHNHWIYQQSHKGADAQARPSTKRRGKTTRTSSSKARPDRRKSIEMP